MVENPNPVTPFAVADKKNIVKMAMM